MILLDTHVVLWWLDVDPRLSARANRELAKSDSLLVSPASCWEIATLVRKRRIRLDRDVHRWIADLFEEDRVSVAPLTIEVATGAGLLPSDSFAGDPADRLLYTTARELLVPFVTKDARIRNYARSMGDVKVLW